MLRTPLIAAAASLTLVAPPAWAQLAPAEVVITGSPSAQRVLDLPFAISAIGSEALRDAGPMVNLSEVMARVPGLVVNNRNNYAQDLQISSRGFGARAGFGVRGLRLYADGIPASMPDGQGQVAHFDLAGAQRIEVLRGPFSVLYGSSSGGVIALFSAPVTSAQSEAGVDIGSFGLRQARASVAAPLGSGLDLRASYSDLHTDGFRPQSAAQRSLGNLQLGWRSAADTLTLRLSDHNQSAQDPLGLKQADFEADARRTDADALKFNTRKTVRQTQAGLNWRHQFGDGLLRESQLTAYQGSRGVTQWQAIAPTTQVNPAVPTAVRQGGGVVDFDRRYGGVEARLAGRLGAAEGGAEWAAGLNVETQQDDRLGFENFTGPATAPTALGVVGTLRRDETNRATTREAFVQGRVPLSAALDLVGGVRGGRITMSTRDRYIKGLNGDDSGDLAYAYVNPALGLRLALAPGWALHASAGRGFESPTLGELAYRPDSAGGFNTDLKPQTSQQLELGSKWRLGTLDLDLALFQADTVDEIGVLSNSSGRSSFQNVGRTQRRGLELAATWRPAAGLRLQAAASWLQARYVDGFLTCTATPCAKAAVPVAAGNLIAGTQRASAWAELAWQPGWLPGELGLEWRAAARTIANDLNTAAAPGYGLAHLRWRASLPLGAADSLETLLRIDNLLDRTYAGSVIVNDGNQRYFEPGAPRSLLLSLRWQHRW